MSVTAWSWQILQQEIERRKTIKDERAQKDAEQAKEDAERVRKYQDAFIKSAETADTTAKERELKLAELKAVGTAKEAAERLLTSFPKIAFPIIYAGVLHLRGETWDKMKQLCKVSKSTISGYLNRFYVQTGLPRLDRRQGMGKKLPLDESRDAKGPDCGPESEEN